MSSRREFIALVGGAAAAWPLAARAQQVGKVPRIGYLSPGSASPGPLAYHDEFQRGLRELGYVEGRNIVIEYRFADGKFDRLGALAAELVQLNVDVIVSVVTQASLAAKNATGTIPIVIVSVGDPVGAGLVASLARPGANVTGNSGMTTEVIGKGLGLFKQTVPNVSPMAVLWNPDNVVYQGQILRETEMAARTLGIQLQTDEFDRTFAAITSARTASLLVLPDPVFSHGEDCRLGRQKPFTGVVRAERACCGRWPNGLRTELCGLVSACCQLRGQARPASAAASATNNRSCSTR